MNDNFVENSDINQDQELNDNVEFKLSQSSLSEYSGVGKAQNVTEFGKANFEKYNLDLTNNENASIMVPEYWEAEKVTCNISNLYDYNRIWVNHTFHTISDFNSWTNETNYYQFISYGYNSDQTSTNDSIYMRFNSSDDSPDPWKYKYSLIKYNFTLPREHIPYENWELSFKYRILHNDSNWLVGTGGTYHNLYFYVNDSFQEFGLPKLDSLVNNTWYDGDISFQPEQYNLYLPGTISLIFKIYYGNVIIDPDYYFEMHYDNITLKISTIPKPSQINLSITDETNSEITEIDDLAEFGVGTINLENIWVGDVGGKEHYFTFSHNSSGNIILSSDIYSQAISYRKTATNLEVDGSEFFVENNSNVQWTMYYTITSPGSFTTDHFFNISKPFNWNITEVIDPFKKNKINETIGTGYGNTTFTIPISIITNGLWKFVAEAPNYVEKATIFRYSNSEWQKNATFHNLDMLKINGTVNNTLIINPTNTNISLNIYYPNETIWYQEWYVPIESNGNYNFSEILINGDSAIAGEYYAQITWHDSNENMTKVGYSLLNFSIIHRTNLTAVNSDIELYTGEPLLLKVKYIDSDFNKSILNGIITYNSTYNASGIMTYQGLGQYFVELDTTSLDLGDYYFSFNASKEYYESRNIKDLIHVEIIAQPLELKISHEVLTVSANSNFTCDVNVTGAFTGALIPNTTIDTDWQSPYSVLDYGDGRFRLIFSTYNLPSQGITEIYTILLSANKTNWGDISRPLTVSINPIPTIINVSESLKNVDINDITEIDVSYIKNETGEIIEDAQFSVTWPGSYSVISEAQGFKLILNTSTLSIDTYTALLKLEKAGYETSYKSIIVRVEQRRIKVNTIGFQDSISAEKGDTIDLQIQLVDENANTSIENAFVTYSWSYGGGTLIESSQGIYQTQVKLLDFLNGTFTFDITITPDGNIYESTQYSFIVAISEPQIELRPFPTELIWGLAAGILALVGILSVIGVRHYIFLPKKREKESKLLARTQKYKDMMNIEALLVA